MRYCSIILSALVIMICSCSEGLKQVKIYSEAGQLEKKYTIDEDSIQQGELLSYYENGKDIFERANYLDGQLEGKRILYFDDGQPEIIENYRNNILTDTLYLFYPSGALKMTSYFNNGIHTGVNTVYYESGMKKEEVIFRNNEEQGKFVEYHPNGKIHWEGQYLNGENEFGELIQYDSTGQMIKKMLCDSLAKCETIWPES